MVMPLIIGEATQMAPAILPLHDDSRAGRLPTTVHLPQSGLTRRRSSSATGRLWEALKVYAAAQVPKELVTIEGAGHLPERRAATRATGRRPHYRLLGSPPASCGRITRRGRD
jgi:hypothetical protein